MTGDCVSTVTAGAAGAGAAVPSPRTLKSEVSSMAPLHELALRYQRVLDGLRGSVRDHAAIGAGSEFFLALHAALATANRTSCNLWEVVQPITLRTKLATSIAAYLERVPWAMLTPQALSQPGGSFGAAVQSVNILGLLMSSAQANSAENDGKSQVATTLIRQVHAPPL